MFNTAHTVAKSEYFILQKYDSIVFFAGYTEAGDAKWLSDKVKAFQFTTIGLLTREARNLNLNKVLAIRELFQVVEIEIEEEVVVDEYVRSA